MLERYNYLLNILKHQWALLSGATVVFGIKVIGAIIALLSNVLLSRFLGAENVGIYFLSLAVVNIAIIVGMVGLNNALIKYSAQSSIKSNWVGLSGLHRNSVVIVTYASTLSTMLVFLFAPWIALYIFHKPDLCYPLRWMCLSIVPMNLVTIYVSMLKGMQKFAGATVTESLGMPVIMIILLLVFRNKIDVSIAGMCYVTAVIVNLGLGIATWKIVTPELIGIKGHFNSNTLLRTSLPLFGVALMNMIMSMSDTVMLGIWKGSHVVGIYGVALRITAVSSMFLVVANTIVAPKFAILFENGEYNSLSRLTRDSTLLMVFIATLFLVLFISIPDFILSLFGEEFVAGKMILIILAIGQFVVLFTGPVAALLMMTGYEKFHRNTTTLSAVLNIVLNFLLIPVYGGVGAAFATTFSLSLKNILAVLHVRKQLNIRLFI